MTRFVLKRADGHIAIMQVSDGANLQECIRKFSEVQFTPVKVVEIDESAIPARDKFRDSWVLKGNKIAHDIEKAKEIKKARVRRERQPLLNKLDIEISRALAKNESVAALEAERQRLRDATDHPSIKKAKTIEDLKAADPLAKE